MRGEGATTRTSPNFSPFQIFQMFVTEFKDAYLRNNRRGGQKNLRCFPECSEKGHRCSGFCGRAVQVRFSTETNNCQECVLQTKDVLSLAEFVTNGKEPTDIVVGSTFPADHFELDTRCKKSPLRRFVRGVNHDEKNNVFSFKPSCWHYGWRSNKHATDTLHFLRVVTFEIDRATSTMTCVSSIDTSKFTLFSSKILDKKTSKRRAPVPKKKTQKSSSKQSKNNLNNPRPCKRVKRSDTVIQEPKMSYALSNAPTEELEPMDNWSKACPPSPVSVTFFDDDAIMDDTQMSLDALLFQLDCGIPAVTKDVKHLRTAQFATTPFISDFVTIDDAMELDNSLFTFDPTLDGIFT